jgi:AcrR family transcriptional regulator
MPRPYELGRRAAPKADTRARIVAAALEIYRDRGLAGASNLAIARAADVAPATVRNHFPETGGLARAVFDAVLTELRIPTVAIFDGLEGLRDRVERLARELAAFYERSEPWWRAYEREPDLISAWGGGVDQYYAEIERLMRAALGDLGGDERSVAVVASVIGPPTFFALKARRLTVDEAVALTLELALPWLEQRRVEMTELGAASDASRGTKPKGRRSSRARPR